MKNVFEFQTLKMAKKLILWNIVLLMIPTLVFVNLLLSKFQNDFEKQAIESLDNEFEEIIASLNENIMIMESLSFSVKYNTYLTDKIAKDRTLTNEDVFLIDKVIVKQLEALLYSYPDLSDLRIYEDNPNLYEFWPVLYDTNRILDYTLRNRIGTSNTLWHIGEREAYFDTNPNVENNKQVVSLFSNINKPTNDFHVFLEVSMELDNFFKSIKSNPADENDCYLAIKDNQILLESENIQTLLDEKQQQELLQAMQTLTPETEDKLFEIKTQKGKLMGRTFYIKALHTVVFKGTLIEAMTSNINFERNRLSIMVLLLVIIMSIIIYSVTKMMFKRLQTIISAVKNNHQTSPSGFKIVEGNDEITALSRHIKEMLDEIDQLNQTAILEQELMREAEIKALLSQINEHFIYNMLETFKMMAEIEESYQLSDLITRFGVLIRYGMDWKQKRIVTLGEELMMIENYIILLNVRCDFTIQLKCDIEPSLLKTKLMKMSIQPLIENAYIHGIAPKAAEGIIQIKCIPLVEEQMILLTIEDNGIGMETDKVEKLNQLLSQISEIQPYELTQTKEIMGIGIKNINDRIKIAYGASFGIVFESQVNRYTRVTVKLPMEVLNEDTRN